MCKALFKIIPVFKREILREITMKKAPRQKPSIRKTELHPRNQDFYPNANLSPELSSEEYLMTQANAGKPLKFSIREHAAEKAGKHLDIVIGAPDSEFVADFVIPKPKCLSELEGTKLALVQPPHFTSEYLLDELNNEHVIEEGYGKGMWKTILKGEAQQQGNKHSFALSGGRFLFKFYKMEEKKWLIRKL